MHNVLSDRGLTMVTGSGPRAVALPEILAALISGDTVHGFSALTAEQDGYWWRFLVRCGMKALHESGLTVQEAAARTGLEEALREVLAAAAPEGAWELYQPDPTRAGFLQPPTPDGAAPEAKYACNPPSLLTGALGQKNHERKSGTVRALTPEQAVYALVEYQTAAIYGGRGNYGSQLLGSASGAGSGTPFMGARLGSLGETFRHDVASFLARRGRMRAEHVLEGPVWALWAEPWDGKRSLPSRRLDPAFIPTARLVRLGAPDEEGLLRTVWFRPTDASRVEDLMGGGNLGDPFTPLVTDPRDRSQWKVRGTLGKGYDYTEVVRLLISEVAKRSPSVEALRESDGAGRGDVRVLFAGVAYEQGKTGGFHRREVLLPPTVGDIFADPEPVRATHRQMLEVVKAVKSALRAAARIYLNGSPAPRDGDGGKTEIAPAAFDREVDARYLRALFHYAEKRATDHDWQFAWGAELRPLARDAFLAALPSLPVSTTRRWERETDAVSYLDYKLFLLSDPAAESNAHAEPEEVTA